MSTVSRRSSQTLVNEQENIAHLPNTGDIYESIVGRGNAIGGRGNINFIYNYASSVAQSAITLEDEFAVLCKGIALKALQTQESGTSSSRKKENAELQQILLEYLEIWAATPVGRYRFLWVHGFQDQAIEHMIDKALWSNCRPEFSRYHCSHNLSNPQTFIATLAFQLVVVFPATREHILDAISQNRKILAYPLEDQAQALIITPLRRAFEDSSDSSSSRWTIFVSGIDRCHISLQWQLLDVMHWISCQKLPSIIISFVVSSLSNSDDIREGLRVGESSLEIDFQHLEAHLAVKQSLQGEFAAFCESSPTDLPPDWPSNSICNELVARTFGQPIYAQTVCRFLRSTGNPTERLDQLKTTGALGGEILSPSENLDTLYTALLSTVDKENAADLLRLLGILLVPYHEKGYKDPTDAFAVIQFKAIRTPAYLEKLFNWKHGFVRRLLANQQHFLDVRGDFEEILFYDSNIRDYFFTKSRSNSFYIDKSKIYADLAENCVHRLSAHSLEYYQSMSLIQRALSLRLQLSSDFQLFFMWNINLFLSEATPHRSLCLAIERCRITKVHEARPYPDTVNHIWPAFLLAIRKLASNYSPLQDLYKEKVREYEGILKDKLKVYFDHKSLKSFIIAMSVQWIALDESTAGMFQISPNEAKEERALGFDILQSGAYPEFMPFIHDLLNNGWGDYAVDDNQYADVALYLFKNVFKRQRAISSASWLRYLSFPAYASSGDAVEKLFPLLLSRCSTRHTELLQFIKSKISVLRHANSRPFLDAVEIYVQRCTFEVNRSSDIWRPI
ncbi:hypothetical protein CVT26_008982 [Gymnopilus dilepis]|uniref:Uncharacterized protein n=1 Tax=Gymnopilus dilepis TaxID=231916 RepID=A0A409YB60_9AGAR|nr:hypothetical protein CVT26_008982 [Gymnopilus dilepis]